MKSIIAVVSLFILQLFGIINAAALPDTTDVYNSTNSVSDSAHNDYGTHLEGRDAEASPKVPDIKKWMNVRGSLYTQDRSATPKRTLWEFGACGLQKFHPNVPLSDPISLVSMPTYIWKDFHIGNLAVGQNNFLCAAVIQIKGPNGVIRNARIADRNGDRPGLPQSQQDRSIDMLPDLWNAFGRSVDNPSIIQMQWRIKQ